MTLFGRDSLLTSWMPSRSTPSLALGTLQALAQHQGTQVQPRTEEEPGRILHEIRSGLSPSWRLGGGTVYYGTADATPLFVMLARRAAAGGALPAGRPRAAAARTPTGRWTGSSTYGDRDGDGFVEYERATDRGPGQPGLEGLLRRDHLRRRGDRRTPPIALAEVQGYVYARLRRPGRARGRLRRRRARPRRWRERAAAPQARRSTTGSGSRTAATSRSPSTATSGRSSLWPPTWATACGPASSTRSTPPRSPSTR